MKRRQGDMVISLAVLALALIGLVMISSSSYVMAADLYDDRYHYIKRHLLYLTLAGVAYMMASTLRLEIVRKLSLPGFAVAVLLLVATLVTPLSSYAGGASRWIEVAGFRFQPSELARLCTIALLANLLSRQQHSLRDSRSLLVPLGIIGMVALFILCEPDFGTAASIVVTGFAMLYIAGARLKHLAPCVLTSVALGAYAMLGSSYRRQRLLAFLDPWSDPMDKGFQIIQSFVAVRSGGLFGQGLGDGVQKIFYLPEAHTDFAFAILGEELGFVGIVGVVTLYLIVVARGALAAARCRERYAALLAAGITFAFGLQAFTNMGVVLGMLPTKGLTLPLISFGGSSLVATALALGLLQNVVKHRQRGEA